MLSGWSKQQRGGRRLDPKTIGTRQRNVQAFVAFSNEYPWRWTASHVEEWTTHLLSELGRSLSTIRNYQGAIRLFCDYITSAHYEWPEVCEARFGTHPTQVCHEWNTAVHVEDDESRPTRRPMSRDEIQALFDHADGQVERAVRSGRKGALAAYRDATVFKVLYGWGLRVNEACRLDRSDFYRNPEAPELGRFGVLHVRYGKASRGSGPRRRAVASVMPWAVEAVEDYLVNIRPRFGLDDHPALWVTERGGRLRGREVDERFARYRDELGLAADLTPHCLRHSYVSHGVEDGMDPEFLRQQVGHRFRSTTGIYTTVSTDHMNTMMRKALDRAFAPIEEGAG
ncbi:tyrosine-type recombinase/integrase [Nocardia puris]|uniref:tyrosine-type recombinase/integrase n=1 Tax=Nocardia puris TaxID=208602 RepID=UPI001895AB01|nr:tyrosine-type recombinase/integrase [Nocardia puris]MBF6216296.1 tyrosine-type recombinase/integrase [Nocardia puris]